MNKRVQFGTRGILDISIYSFKHNDKNVNTNENEGITIRKWRGLPRLTIQ